MTPKGHYVSLTRNLKHIGRYGTLVTLRQYVRKDGFLQSLTQLSPMQRETVLSGYAEAKRRCEERSPAPRANNGRQQARVRWNELMIARLRKAVQRLGPADDLVGRELGISRDAARRAIERYVAVPMRWAA